MALFNIFKKNNKTLNPFFSFINFDLHEVLNTSELIDEHKDDKGNLMYKDYIAKLNNNVLNVFDTLKIRLFSDIKEINKEFQIGLTFLCRDNNFSIDNVKYVVNIISTCLKSKDNIWSDIDAIHIEQGNWRGRVFFPSEFIMVAIQNDELDGFSLSITGYNNYI